MEGALKRPPTHLSFHAKPRLSLGRVGSRVLTEFKPGLKNPEVSRMALQYFTSSRPKEKMS